MRDTKKNRPRSLKKWIAVRNRTRAPPGIICGFGDFSLRRFLSCLFGFRPVNTAKLFYGLISLHLFAVAIWKYPRELEFASGRMEVYCSQNYIRRLARYRFSSWSRDSAQI